MDYSMISQTKAQGDLQLTVASDNASGKKEHVDEAPAAQHLPAWRPNTVGFEPNLLKSALFRPGVGVRRVFSEFGPIQTFNESKINYKGVELRQDDFRVLLGVLKHKKPTSSAESFLSIHARKFASALGWADSGSSAAKVVACLHRLHEASVHIELPRAQGELCFFSHLTYKPHKGHYEVRIAEQLVSLLNLNVTFLRLNERLTLSDGLESWLYGVVKTDSKGVIAFDLRKLRLAANSSYEQKNFNRAIKTVLQKFVDRYLIEGYRLEDGKIRVKPLPWFE